MVSKYEERKMMYGHLSAGVALLLVLIHQSIVAGSSIFLTAVIEQFQSHQDFSVYLYLHLFSMAIPYLPGCLSFIFCKNGSMLPIVNLSINLSGGCPARYRYFVMRSSETRLNRCWPEMRCRYLTIILNSFMI